MTFAESLFGKTNITIPSAKRSAVERQGMHAWHPYYAGYSEAFVSGALTYLGCNDETLVLDPWGGSGTTNIVATRNGISSVSIDINPAMSIFGAAKSPHTLQFSAEIIDFFKSLPTNSSGNGVSGVSDRTNFETYFGPETSTQMAHWIEGIPFPRYIEPEGRAATALPNGVSTVRPFNPPYAFCLAVMFVTMRRLAMVGKGANPTWLLNMNDRPEIDPGRILQQFSVNAASMLDQLTGFYVGCCNGVPSYSVCADVRALPIVDESVDRVITSPPYLTRIDYAMSTAPELAAFGNANFLTEVRHSTMGAPVVTRNDRYQKEEWGNLCNDILDRIRAHDTKAASSYYWKNIVQYFMDADAALKELYRVLTPGGSGILVVQSSYFKEIEIVLGDIYVDMCRGIGFSSTVIQREAVRGHLAHVNTRSSKYKNNKTYFEDLILFSKA